VAPFGTWSSPVSAEMLADEVTSLNDPRLDGDDVYWLEGRPSEGGRVVLVRGDPWSSPSDVTPDGFSVRTTVHEYGGGAYALSGGMVVFSNLEDQRLYRHEVGTDPTPVTPDTDGRHRYANGVILRGELWIGVRERHEGSGAAADVVNELVAVPLDGSASPRIVAEGRDFYAAPAVSPDGTRIAVLAWDLPWMPWDGCELLVGDIAPDGSCSELSHVAGAVGEESIWQPGWSPNGDLHFVSDRSGWWNLERMSGGERQALFPREVEFGWPHWVFAGATYGFCEDGRIVCIYDDRGTQHVAMMDPESGEHLDLDLPYSAISYPYLRAEGTRVVFVGSAPTLPKQIVCLDVAGRSVDVLRESGAGGIDEAFISVPETVEIPGDGGLAAYARYYPPRNPGFTAPDGERPPLVVMSHGGPTSQSSGALSLDIQFWTTRGFAVADVNFTGSTGFGREYRRALNGRWGIVDTADCVNAALQLAADGAADPDRLLIRGESAGGYATLCALTFHDVFAGGASYFGVSDLETLATDTHKFESGYLETLVGPYPEAAEIYRSRSPIHFVDRLSRPMIIFQGDEDEVVPPAQAEVMVAALRAKGLPHAYVLFDGEGHGFRRAESIRRAAEAELAFYGRVFGFQPAGDPVPPPIENLPEARSG
jgi:dipeptidyl aminopeptidase/acylaminoacyl peptidase